MNIDRYPYPIAHAWRLATDKQYGATVKHINVIGCAYQSLRFCSLAFAGWYLYRLPQNRALQKALQQLRHPTMGQWVSFIRTSLKYLYTEDLVETYIPLLPLVTAVKNLEMMRWEINTLTPNPPPELFRGTLTNELDSFSKSEIEQINSSGLSPFAWFTQHRNTHHGHFATLTDVEVEVALNGVLPRLGELLEALSCLSEYQLVHRDSITKSVVLLSGDEGKDFKTIKNIPSSLFDSEEFSQQEEQVALIYPNSELAIPLTYLVTREQENDKYEGLVKFRTATIAREPMFYEGIDARTQQIVYLGSGTRSLRSKSFEAVNNLFGSEMLSNQTSKSIDAIDHLRQEVETQLNLLYGIKYQPHTYVTRDIDFKLKQTLNNSSANEKPCVLLIGASGTGKSNLLCRLADDLLSTAKNKHHLSLRLAEVIGNGQTLSLEQGLANDLGFKSVGRGYTLDDLFNYWSASCQKRKIKNPVLWILWDALNEGHDLETLLNWVDKSADIIRRWNTQSNNFGQVRLIVSCRSEPWEHLTKKVQQRDPESFPLKNTECFQWAMDANSNIKVPYWYLPKFGPNQARLAYEKYKDWAILNHAPHSRIAWHQINTEHLKALHVPINCWLFHRAFDGLEIFPSGEINTSFLWQSYLEHIVSRHSIMGQAIEIIGELMWQKQQAVLDVEEILAVANQRFVKQQEEKIVQLGISPEAFYDLPPAIQNELLKGNSFDNNFFDPVEILQFAGLILISQEGIITPTYQTLTEAIAGWVLWRDILPNWEPHKGQSLRQNLSSVPSNHRHILQERLKSWLERTSWAEGRTALLQFWAWCAEDALQQGMIVEAKENLTELQLRGYTGTVIELIETHLPTVIDQNFRLYLVSVLIDMIHLRGHYQRAAEMIEEELVLNTSLSNHQLPLLSLQIRLIHHQMFYQPVSELFKQMYYLSENYDHKYGDEKYGEILFMLGGNLGTLFGNYRESRKYLFKAIRIGQRTGDDYLTCRSLRKYTDFLRHRGHLSFARQIWNKAWEISEAKQQTRQGIYLLYSLGDLERQEGNFKKAEGILHKALTASRSAGIRGWIGHAHLAFAELYLAQNQLESATQSLEAAAKFYRQINHCWGQIQVLIGQARVKLLQDDTDWVSIANRAMDKAHKFGYQRDYEFARRLLDSHQTTSNCLMFL